MTKDTPDAPDEKRAAAAYQGALYRLMPRAQLADRHKAAAAALTDDCDLFAPDWEKFASQRLLRVREAAALALGINPDHVASNPVWVRDHAEHASPSVSKRLRQYLGVLKEATFDIRCGELVAFGSNGQLPEDFDVKVDAFGVWATKLKLATHPSFVALYAEDPPEIRSSRPPHKGLDQEQWILARLRQLGASPERLPKGQKGREGTCSVLPASSANRRRTNRRESRRKRPLERSAGTTGPL